MIDMQSIDERIMRSMRGADVHEALFYPAAGGDPLDSLILIATLELNDEFGVPKIQSGAEVRYLRSQVGDPKIGDRWEVNGKSYKIENKVPSQDPSMRVAHCKVKEAP